MNMKLIFKIAFNFALFWSQACIKYQLNNWFYSRFRKISTFVQSKFLTLQQLSHTFSKLDEIKKWSSTLFVCIWKTYSHKYIFNFSIFWSSLSLAFQISCRRQTFSKKKRSCKMTPFLIDWGCLFYLSEAACFHKGVSKLEDV